MAEETNIILANDGKVLGHTEVNPTVLEVIAGIAANEVDGVIKMQSSISNQVSELFGRVEHGKGVKVSVTDNVVIFDVYVFLEYGVSVPKVSLKLQEHIKSQVHAMTELTVAEINVHIEGIVPKKADHQLDPNNLFGDEDAPEEKGN